MKIEKGLRVKGRGLRRIAMLMVIACAIVLVSAPAFATVVLEVHSDEQNNTTTFTDSSGSAHAITPSGGVKHSTATYKFGGSSMSFDGDGDYLVLEDHDDWSFGAGEFAIDFWFIIPSSAFGTTSKLISNWRSSATQDRAWDIYFHGADGTGDDKIKFQYDYNGLGADGSIMSNAAVNADTWQHIAIVRDSSNDLKMYINGAVQTDFDNLGGNSLYDSPIGITIGSSNEAVRGCSFSSNLDDIYIRKGEALDTTDLTYIINNGGERFEAYDSITDGTSSFILGYTSGQNEQLTDFYLDGKGGSDPDDITIGGTKWRYYDTLDYQGSYARGDAYEINSRKYIYLGSGIAEVTATLTQIEDANTTLGLTYSEAETDQLLALYEAGKAGGEPEDIIIQGTKWRYFAELPEEGEGRPLGDAYTINGLNYIYLGSGVGQVPELPASAPFISLLFGIGMKLIRRKK